MSKPNVFVSSTYIDLREVRASLDVFIDSMGFKATMFEKGGIPFDYDKDADRSCYEEVMKSDLFILIIGGRFGSPTSDDLRHIRKRMKKYNSIIQKEYETALASNIPIHVFVDNVVQAGYETWLKNNRNMNLEYAHVDNPSIFELIESVYNSDVSQFVKPFTTANEISGWLRQQWAGLFKNFLMQKRKQLEKRSCDNEKVRVNCYKLYYFRRSKGISLRDMEISSGISKAKYALYERPSKEFKHGETVFPFASEIDVQLIAIVLEIHKSELKIGRVDDFSYQYYEYFNTYRGKQLGTKLTTSRSLFQAKVVVFDFDGTLTKQNTNLNVWEELWLKAGYTVNDCAKYTTQFKRGVISHQQWCDVTLKYFQKGKLTKNKVLEVARKFTLLDDVPWTLKHLKEKGISLHVLSGSIDVVIREVLGVHENLFSTIKSNSMRYKDSGDIDTIIGTKYDFEGKALYLKELAKLHDVHPYEILYIGNSMNDRFAYLSGARTLCINPHFVDGNDPKEWTNNIRDLTSLKDILPYVLSN